LLVESLMQHAEKGSLKHLMINDNTCNTKSCLKALCTLISLSTNLLTLNIDSLGIEDEDD